MSKEALLVCNPSEVSHQTGSFDKGFAKHHRRFAQEKVQNWRSALKQVTRLAGWHARDFRSDVMLIEGIASTVSEELFKREGIRRKSHSESDLLVKIQANLVSPEIANILSKRLKPDKIKQSLVNLVKARARTPEV
ncbi:hypothetical protein L6164_023378 [Bauhinia variegata]|uniref:Uncharacterized protein n=1 Tax=Bauhinia variegata TaxID=167791 RepID=A0ACB9MK07_BAUVA|nr:hypothetical protein L6164_023378 [Bauhinia variegata]